MDAFMHQPWWVYALACWGLIATFLWLRKLRNWRRALVTKSDLITYRQKVVEDLAAALPEAVDVSQQKKLDALRNQVAQMRKEREQAPWVRIGVQLRGLKGPGRYIDGGCYATVELNVLTGQMRAAPKKFRDGIEVLCGSNSWWRGANPGVPLTSLGAPPYQRVQDDPTSIILLGERYSMRV